MIYLAIGLSGMAALGAEVVWTRLISLMLGGTVYTFSIILAVFLVGLGIGSTAGSMIARSARLARVGTGHVPDAIGRLNLLDRITSWPIPYPIGRSTLHWPVTLGMSFSSISCERRGRFCRALALWGASFPLALAAVAGRGQDPGGSWAAYTRPIRWVRSSAALAFSVWVIPSLGTLTAQRILIGISFAAAVMALLFRVAQPRKRWVAAERRSCGAAWESRCKPWPLSLWDCCSPAYLTPVPWGMVAYGRHMATVEEHACGRSPRPKKRSCEHDRSTGSPRSQRRGQAKNNTASTSAKGSMSRWLFRIRATGAQNFHGAGKVQASNQWQDMRLQRLLGHISALAVKNPENVLVVACGAGVTAGSFIVHPEVKRIVICDIEPLVPTVVTPMFGKENYRIVDNIAKENPTTVDGQASRSGVRRRPALCPHDQREVRRHHL